MFICTCHSRGVGNASRNDRLIENSIQCNVTGILDVLVRYGRLIGPSSINQHFRIHNMDDRMVPRDGSPWFPVDPGDSEEDFDFTLKPISFFMEQIWWSDTRVCRWFNRPRQTEFMDRAGNKGGGLGGHYALFFGYIGHV